MTENDFDETMDPIDMNQLQARIEQQQRQYLELFTSSQEMEHRPENVHIIVFNPGTDEEGVHAIEFPLGSGRNIVLAFESQNECVAFVTMLKHEGSYQYQNAMSAESPLDDIEEFCISEGLAVKIVPPGKDLRPPSENVDDLLDEEVEDDNEGEVQSADSWQ